MHLATVLALLFGTPRILAFSMIVIAEMRQLELFHLLQVFRNCVCSGFWRCAVCLNGFWIPVWKVVEGRLMHFSILSRRRPRLPGASSCQKSLRWCR